MSSSVHLHRHHYKLLEKGSHKVKLPPSDQLDLFQFNKRFIRLSDRVSGRWLSLSNADSSCSFSFSMSLPALASFVTIFSRAALQISILSIFIDSRVFKNDNRCINRISNNLMVIYLTHLVCFS